MKNTYLLIVACLFIFSCSDNKTGNETVITETNASVPSSSAGHATDSAFASKPDSNMSAGSKKTISMAELEGKWSQEHTIQNGPQTVTESIVLELFADGNFVASASLRTNQKAQNAPEKRGKWTLYDHTVSLSGMRILMYHEESKTLIDAVNKVELKRE